ncbi:MAG: TolC family protein [Acidobacteria bacterium]|nr:TolC family protein [Acidobacteriota bacterium]
MRVTGILFALALFAFAPSLALPPDDDAKRPAGLQSPYVPDLFHHQFAPPEADPVNGPEAGELQGLIRDGKLRLRLEDAIRLAVRNNLDVHLQRLEIRDRHQAYYQSEAPFEPVWSQNFAYAQDKDPSPSTVTGIFHNWTRSISTNQVVSKYFPTGATLAADISFQRFESNQNQVLFSPSYIGTLTFSFNQHLLRGRGREVNRAPVLIARNAWKIAESDFRHKLEQLVLDVEKQYWDVLYARTDLEVKQESLRLSEKTRDDTFAQVEAGTQPELNLYKARAETARRLQEVIAAETTLRNLQQKLLGTLTPAGPPIVGPALAVELEALDPHIEEEPLSFAEAADRAVERRGDVRRAKIGLESSEIALKQAKNRLLPALDFSASYTQHGLKGGLKDLPGVNPDLIAALNNEFSGNGWESLGQMMRGRYNGFALQLSLVIPIGNLDARAAYARATIDRDYQGALLDQARQQVVLTLQTVYNNLERDRGLIAASREGRVQAEKDLEGEQAKFEAGVSVIRDLLESQRNLAQARSQEVLARIAYRKSLLDYYFATAQLLDKHGIQVAPSLERN